MYTCTDVHMINFTLDFKIYVCVRSMFSDSCSLYSWIPEMLSLMIVDANICFEHLVSFRCNLLGPKNADVYHMFYLLIILFSQTCFLWCIQIHGLFSLFDVDNDSMISCDDFISCLRRHPLLIALFAPILFHRGLSLLDDRNLVEEIL